MTRNVLGQTLDSLDNSLSSVGPALRRGMGHVFNTGMGAASTAVGGLGMLAGEAGTAAGKAVERLGGSDTLSAGSQKLLNDSRGLTRAGLITAGAGGTMQQPEAVAQQWRRAFGGNPQSVNQWFSQSNADLRTKNPTMAGIQNLAYQTGQEAIGALPAATLAGAPGLAAGRAANLVRGVGGYGLMESGFNSTPAQMAMNGARYSGDVQSASDVGMSMAAPTDAFQEGYIGPESGQLSAKGQTTYGKKQRLPSGEMVSVPVPGSEQISNFVKTNPGQAKEFANQAASQLRNNLAGTPEAIAGTQQALATGELPPPMADKALSAWTDAGFDPQKAMNIVGQMGLAEKILLGAGLGLGVLGLIRSLSGEGGVGSWLLSALGLGTAAFIGGNNGLLGQTAQQAAGGIKNTATGMAGSVAQSLIPKVMSMLSDEQLSQMMPYLDQYLPAEQRKLLDQASGRGGGMNNLTAMLGGVTGQTANGLSEFGLTDPEQQQRLLQQWKSYPGSMRERMQTALTQSRRWR